MNSTDFVKNVIDNLVEKIPSIQCTYQYDDATQTHFVEVLPGSIYSLDEEYAKLETQATLEFIAKYPQESICFITEDDIIKLNAPIYVKTGEMFLISLPNFAMTNTFLSSNLLNLNTPPFTISVPQNYSIHEMLMLISKPIVQENEYWMYPSYNRLPPISTSIVQYWEWLFYNTANTWPIDVISDEAENELSLAA